MHPIQSLFILLATLLALTACTGTSPQKTPPVDTGLVEEARLYTAQGDFAGAAQLYLDKAQTAPARAADDLRLSAAQYLALGALWDRLDDTLKTINSNRLSGERKIQLQLVEAELALARDDQNRALGLLQAIKNPETLPDHGQQYYRLRAKAYAMAGNPLEAARQLIVLDSLLSNPEERKTTQLAIWEQLSVLSDQALVQLRTSPPPDTLSGWMELVLLTRNAAGEPREWSQTLEDWRFRYPQHPAGQVLLPAMLEQAVQPGPQADRIAVLLPFSGRTGNVAASIRDGILAAWYSDQIRPEIRFYDTSSSHAAWPLYQQAVEEGAEIVIGPLLKDKIQELADAGPLAIPVLALNQIDTETDKDTGTDLAATDESDTNTETVIYQFGLAPEDEARQAAERIMADGHLKIVAMAPDNAWGQRVLEAFRVRFNELGGAIVETASYSPTSADFGEPIKDLLNLTGSQQRHRAVERLFGEKLQFQPRRRRDASAVFLLAFPRQARLIQPQLRFHGAGDLPVYSTSHVFTGKTNAALDKDMEGIRFCDIPWLLDQNGSWIDQREQLDALWPTRSQRYPRLFALGIDAYRVLPWLKTLENPGPGSFTGATGTLNMDPHRHLHRRLKWARFRKGTPILLEDRHYFIPVDGTQEYTTTEFTPDMSREGQHESQGYREPR